MKDCQKKLGKDRDTGSVRNEGERSSEACSGA